MPSVQPPRPLLYLIHAPLNRSSTLPSMKTRKVEIALTGLRHPSLGLSGDF
jgi:hypothetical protein